MWGKLIYHFDFYTAPSPMHSWKFLSAIELVHFFALTAIRQTKTLQPANVNEIFTVGAILFKSGTGKNK